MPQMSPINWLSLFIILSITFAIFNMMIYFSFFPSTPKLNFSKNKMINSMNWKW